MVHVLFEIQTLMPTILFIDKNHGKTSTPKSEGSCIFQGTVDRCIGQHLGRQSINIPAAMLADTRSRVRRISAEYRPISRSSGVLLSLTYWSTDRSTVGRDSISSVSTIYWWIVSWVSVRYQWCISQQSVSPRVGWPIYPPSDVLLLVEYRSTNQPTVSRDSISSMSPEYRWTVGRLYLVRYQWCIGQQSLLLLLYALPFVTRFLTSAETQWTLMLVTHISFGW